MAIQSHQGFEGAARSCLTGGGEMGALMRELDWSASPLGPVEVWPQSLRTSVSTCLNSRFPILIWWGTELVMLYNDAYREIIGSKHPAALGRPGRQCWPEIWHVIGPMLANVLECGEATRSDDLLLLLERHGYAEECYFTFSYSPIRDESGSVGGVFTPVAETTEKVIGARRLKTLQELASHAYTAKDVGSVCRYAAETLSANTADHPFSGIYLYGEDRRTAELAGRSGAASSLPTVLSFPARPDDWIAIAAESGRVEQIIRTEANGPWPFAVDSAIVLPLASSSLSAPAGFLVAGINPYKRLDEAYRTFLDLVAGQIATAIGYARAFDEERKRAEALAELDRAKTTFFSNVSHEFRTPLTLILGPLENALDSPSPVVSPQELQVIHRNGLRLLKLVNTLLDFSRIEAGRVRAAYEPTDLARLTSDVASAFRSAVEKSGLTYTVDCPPLDEPVYVDREMWEKIVLNLVSNAYKFTFTGGIRISLRQSGGRAELVVQDTGVGIPENELPHVFERFHRIEGSRGRTHEGSGIGLAFVYELVKLHGGHVAADSRVGEGSTFTVAIPLGSAHLPSENLRSRDNHASPKPVGRFHVEEAVRWTGEAGSGSAPTETGRRVETGTAKARVLVVDDNGDMRDYLRSILRDRYDVVAAHDGESAMGTLRAIPCDLVVSDVMMPRLDGFGLIERIRSNPDTCSLPVILLSARAGEESGIEGLQAGADAYVAKPFSARELLAHVESHLSIARLRLAAAEREKQLRREAEQERQRWKDLLENAPAGMAVLRGPDHEFVIVNEEYARATGRPGPAYFRGKRFREVFPELVGQGLLDIFTRVYESGEPVVGKSVPLKLDFSGNGQMEERFFNCAYQPTWGAAGEIDSLLIHQVDVTEEVIAQRRLEESEAQFRSLADSIPNLAWIAGVDGSRLWFNQRWREYTGLEQEETAGWGWTQAHDPERVGRVVANYKRRIENGELWEDRVRLRKRTGEYGWFLSRAIPIRNSSGQVVRWFGTNTDITHEMEAQQSLRESEERATGRASELQAIMDAVPAAIYIAREPECKELVGNRAAYEWLGLAALGQPIQPLSDGDNARPYRVLKEGKVVPVNQLPLQVAARTLRPVHDCELEFENRGGLRRTVHGNAVPLTDSAGNGRGAVAAFIDVTESRRMQDRLREAQRLESIGLLAGGVAHDFNNLLVPVVGYAGLARDMLDSSSPVRPLMEEIEKAGERAADLTRQMLAYAGKARFVLQSVDVERAVRETINLAAASVTKSVLIDVQAEMPLPNIQADPGEIRQIAMNLVLNAAEALGGERGHITVRLSLCKIDPPTEEAFEIAGDLVNGLYVCLEVTDTGCGIDPAARSMIFEPFFSTKFLGRGLGLAAVAGIVRAHHWAIRVRTAPGHGSTFQVYMRAATEPAESVERARPGTQVAESGAGSILVIDDEDLVLKTARLALERQGYQVFTASSGSAGLTLFTKEARSVDLVLLDVSMPGMDGRETLAALEQIDPKVKALISSGYSEGEALRSFAGRRTVGFVQKPYTLADLASKVKLALSHP
ncbi:MAG: response regulator [Bryobacteraceae bacterium]